MADKNKLIAENLAYKKQIMLIGLVLELQKRKKEMDKENNYITNVEYNCVKNSLSLVKGKINSILQMGNYLKNPKYWSDEEYKIVCETIDN